MVNIFVSRLWNLGVGIVDMLDLRGRLFVTLETHFRQSLQKHLEIERNETEALMMGYAVVALFVQQCISRLDFAAAHI